MVIDGARGVERLLYLWEQSPPLLHTHVIRLLADLLTSSKAARVAFLEFKSESSGALALDIASNRGEEAGHSGAAPPQADAAEQAAGSRPPSLRSQRSDRSTVPLRLGCRTRLRARAGW